MTRQQLNRAYLHQYALLPKLLGLEPTPEVTEEALAFFMCRDAVTGVARHELARLDEQFAEALAATSDEWLAFLDGWAEDLGLAAAPWWVAVRSRSGREAKPVATSPTS